ncbi:MAG: hypothetical protein ACK52D_08650 [Burkholderiales bacterium]
MTQKEITLAVSVLILVVVALLAPALPQDQAYHAFADARAWWGIPNAADTLSNLAFVVVGLYGLLLRAGHPFYTQSAPLRAWSQVFFLGLIATGLGSGWYHWLPQDSGLAVDRYGMVLAFAGVLGAIATHKVSTRAGHALGWVSLLLGISSVFWWQWQGNLTPYAVLQFGGIALVLWLACLPATQPGPRWGWLLCAYIIAKVCETFDQTLFDLTQHLISGHTLKHLWAAAAGLAFFKPAPSQARAGAQYDQQ